MHFGHRRRGYRFLIILHIRRFICRFGLRLRGIYPLLDLALLGKIFCWLGSLGRRRRRRRRGCRFDPRRRGKLRPFLKPAVAAFGATHSAPLHAYGGIWHDISCRTGGALNDHCTTQSLRRHIVAGQAHVSE